jgi:phenylalanyl-tRNA synthetase beta chain
MYITRKWLDKFIDITSVKDEEITVALNSLGFEVDSYKDYKGLNDNLVIGQVGSITKIEGTHLNFCFVDVNEDLASAIVCGADNVREGQFVLTALPGTKIANGLTIEKRELRGKPSEGMICALTEIGFDNSKIADFESDSIYEIFTKEEMYSYLGDRNALDIIGFNDSVWEVDLTLNRSDALAALQIVKELANYFGVSRTPWKEFDEKIENYSPEKSIAVSVEGDSKKVVRSLSTFTIQKKEILTIDERWTDHIYAEDDIWLRNSGAKPSKSFWVNFANMIALETGQPVIFLDPAKINGELKIMSHPEDKKEVGLKLFDGENEVATFGVSVNPDYEPVLTSKEILVVVPSLDPIFMRKQQKAYNMSTIALQRFMKPISSKLAPLVFERTKILADHYNILSQISKINEIISSKEEATKIVVKKSYLTTILGFEIESKKLLSLFEELDFTISENDDEFIFEVDQNRTDISMPADIAEEVARLYGYDNIVSKPLELSSVMKTKKINKSLKDQVESFFLGQGFANAKTYSLISKETAAKWDLFSYKSPIDLAMPLSALRETYRLSLIPSLIDAVILNSNRGNKNIRIYEFADIYNMNNLRDRHLGFAVAGDILNSKAHGVGVKNEWAMIKGMTETVISHYNVDLFAVDFTKMQNEMEEVHPYINAEIKLGNDIIGFITKLNPLFEQKNKIAPTFVVDLNISMLEKLAKKDIRWNEISKFQKTSRDISIILGEENNFAEIVNSITKGVKFLEGFELVDIYSDEELEKIASKSYTVTFIFNDKGAQLTDEQVAKEFDKIVEAVKTKGIVIR